MEGIEVKKRKISDTCAVKDEDKVKELQFAAFIACHRIKSADHLIDILNTIDSNSKQCQTKPFNLINSVIAPSILQELVIDVGDRPYSLIVEFTNGARKKYLYFCIKYFSINQNRTVTDFLGFIELDELDAESLHGLVVKFLEEINLPLINLIGLGTDGTSNLCGETNSLYALLKFNVPKLQLIRFVYRSPNSAASAAADKFPEKLEFLLREVYKWFALNVKRQREYRALWEILREIDNEENSKDFRQYVEHSETRWLARYNVVKVIVDNYFQLQVCFSSTTEICYISGIIKQTLNDTSNYLYLKIVKPILYEVNKINLSLQREIVDAAIAYEELKDLILLLARKLLKPSFISENLKETIDALGDDNAFLSPQNADYGIEYSAALLEHEISVEIRANIEGIAFKYIKELCLQLSSRLPENIESFERLKLLSPVVCLSQKRRNFKDLPFLNMFAKESELALLENQYSMLLSINWSEHLDENTLSNSYEFWAYVCNFKTSGNKCVFRELALFALTILSLPSSSAVVERIIAVMSVVENISFNHRRDIILSKLFESVLRLIMHFFSRKMCSTNFKPSIIMLKNFNSTVVHQNQNESATVQDEHVVINVLNKFDWLCIF